MSNVEPDRIVKSPDTRNNNKYIFKKPSKYLGIKRSPNIKFLTPNPRILVHNFFFVPNEIVLFNKYF